MIQKDNAADPDTLTIVVLAAGKGTRMKSAKAKVLHEVFYQPMLHHVLHATEALQPQQTIVIIGHQEESVKEALAGFKAETVLQEKQQGTGHAVLMTEPAIAQGDSMVMILCGDSPLIRPESLQMMYRQHIAHGAQITVMTTVLENPTGYGRIVSQGQHVVAIVEEKEADDTTKKIQEINTGIYIVKRDLLFEGLRNITPNNSQGEFYLTDIVSYSVSQGIQVDKCFNPHLEETLGVNSRIELEAAHRKLQLLRNKELILQGVTMHNSDSISISPSASIGQDTLIKQNVEILGSSVVGESCIIENGVILKNCRVGRNVHIGAYCVMEDCTIASDAVIPPLSFLSQTDSCLK